MDSEMNGRRTILFVDNDPFLGSVIVRFLSQWGFTVLHHYDGVEGAVRAQEHRGNIDLLITDVMMPKKDGLTLAADVQRLRPTTQVLFVTGHVEDDAALRSALDMSGAECLTKPFTQQQLRETVNRILGLCPAELVS